jgi:hypothetical protein
VSAASSKARLGGLLRQLLIAWEQTQTTWTDQQAREFHQRYLVELIAEVEKSIAALDQLEKVVHRMKDDCE